MQDPDFWHEKWHSNKIGFHQDGYHRFLLKYWPILNLENDLGVPKTSTVLVPLCGKTSDMLWLVDQGHNVIGAELSPIAAQDFFTEKKMPCEIIESGKFKNYTGGDISILVGDFFDLSTADVSNTKAVYDRAALIALPAEMRIRYAQHLKSILNAGDQILLIALAYDQSKIDGPPFSVTGDEVNKQFGDWCTIETLETLPPENFRGIEAFESVYKLVVK